MTASWGQVAGKMIEARQTFTDAPVRYATEGVADAEEVIARLRVIGQGFSELLGTETDFEAKKRYALSVGRYAQRGSDQLHAALGDSEPSVHITKALRAGSMLEEQAAKAGDAYVTMADTLREITALASRLGQLATDFNQAHAAANNAAQNMAVSQQRAIDGITDYL